MNTTARRLTQFTMIAALAAAAVMASGVGERAAPQDVVQLDTVVVTGHRASLEAVPMVELPMVVITGKRSADDTLVAQKGARSAAAKAAV